MRNTTERRQAILEVMCDRRHEQIENLAFEFKVTRRTVETDIQILSLSYPIYTTKGTGGGVHVFDGYYIGRRYLKTHQLELLERLSIGLNEVDLSIMREIFQAFALKIPKKEVIYKGNG